MALNNISLSISTGKFIAIVGMSGSGKSTLLQLIERFYDPLEGSIYIDGINIKALNLSSLRQKIGFVSQELALFSTSILENVWHGFLVSHQSLSDLQDEKKCKCTRRRETKEGPTRLQNGQHRCFHSDASRRIRYYSWR